VALLSGGKDSCYTIMELHRQGHELVCLANLYPAPTASPEGGETDSFMYQSAGHDAIEALAECLDRPLLRRAIEGSSANQRLQYAPTKGDEVEDLYLLLQAVRAAYPEVQGVASGAIFSTYQRTRVENVCSRLALTSLAPLWQREQSSLLQHMIDSRVEAVLVKVASMGLDPHKHLGKSIAQLQPHFAALHARQGFHQCGEGGEYETLTLDCAVFVKRLVLDKTVLVMHSDDMFAPVGLLQVVQCHAEPKQDAAAADDAAALGAVLCADETAAGELLACRTEIADDVDDDIADSIAATATTMNGSSVSTAQQPAALQWLPHVYESSAHLHVSAVMCPSVVTTAADSFTAAAAQMTQCFALLTAALAQYSCDLHDIVFTHLYLADMGHFAAVNAAYSAAFAATTSTSSSTDSSSSSSSSSSEAAAAERTPPSRCCVQAALPAPCLVMLDCIAQRSSGSALLHSAADVSDRGALHVRSLSSWAPLCVGPYSQANTLASGALVLLAGQIGLLPSTMAAAPAAEQLGWCARHAARVLGALDSSTAEGVLCATLYVTCADVARGCSSSSSTTSTSSAAAVQERWWGRKAEVTRQWLRCNGGRVPLPHSAAAAGSDSAEEGWNSEADDSDDVAAAGDSPQRTVPLLLIAVDQLPRGCDCELELLCASHTALALMPCSYYTAQSAAQPLAAAQQQQQRYVPPDWIQLPAHWLAAQTTAIASTASNTNSGSSSSGSTQWLYSVSTEASTMQRTSCQGFCVLSLQQASLTAPTAAAAAAAVAVSSAAAVAVSSAAAEALATALLEAVQTAVTSAGLMWRHVANLRVYHTALTDSAALRENLLLALRSCTKERPALSIVPVVQLQPGALLALQFCALDLPKMRTELWVRREA
jgi:diphthine-ammonia ligase